MFKKFGQDLPESLVNMVSDILEAKHDEPAAPDADAIARRKRLQALKDKQEDDAAEKGYEKEKPAVRKIAGKAYGGAKQKDEPEQQDEGIMDRAKEIYHNVQANRYASKHAELSDTDKEKSKQYADIANQHKFKRQELTKKRTGSTSNYYEEVEQQDEAYKNSGDGSYHNPHKDLNRKGGFSWTTKSKEKEKENKKQQNEELKGNQSKIDANKNGKIDADDFKKLRAGKKDEACDCKEETDLDVEQIEERELSSGETAEKERIVKSMKKNIGGFKKRYGERAKNVMYATATKLAKESRDEDLPFTPDAPHKPIVIAGKKGYGVSASHHLARMGLKQVMDKAKKQHDKITSEESVEESRGHKILATKLRQIDTMSTGIAPDHSTNVQSTKDKIKDSGNIKQVEIVTQKDTSVKKEEVEQVNELSKGTLNRYISKAADPLSSKSNVNLASRAASKLASGGEDDGEKEDRKAYTRSKGIQRAAGKLAKEEVEIQETAALDQYIKSMGYDPIHMDKNKKVMFSKTNAFKQWATRQEGLYDAGQKGTQDIDTHMSPGATARG